MAKSKAVNYGELVQVLTGLGYSPDPDQSAEGYTVFRHPGRPLPIILQSFKARTPVRPIYLVGIRRILAESAPAEAAQFESWIEGRMSPGTSGVPVR